jgi:hypothetical protein
LNRFRKKPTNADRTRQRDARLLPGVVRELLHPDHRAEEWDEQGRARRHALPAQLEHVAELVDEDEEHEADRERQAPDPRVRGDRDEHRDARREDLQLQQDAAELDDQEAERDQRRSELAE